MRRTLQQSLLLVAGSVLLGLLANAVSPRGIPLRTPPRPTLVPTDVVSLAEAQQLWQASGAVFLDARNPADYAAGHIANAWNLPAEAFDQSFPSIAPMLAKEGAIVIYCDGVQCDLSHHLRDALRLLGFRNIRILVNGWTAWQQAGLPVAKGAQP